MPPSPSRTGPSSLSPPLDPSLRIAVVGAGLAGGLAALALARRGASVLLLAPEPPERVAAAAELAAMATACSYGALQGWSACGHWRRLEQRHGPLGFQRGVVVLHGGGGPLGVLPPWLQALGSTVVGVGRVDPPRLLAALPAALGAAGVERRGALVQHLAPRAGGGWQLQLHSAAGVPAAVTADQVVLAAGAGCRGLWPALPERLGVSWAGLLELPRNPGGNRWLDLVSRGRVVLARHGQRLQLEARCGGLVEPAWIVDPGLAPAGAGVVLGQISLVRPGGAVGPAPEPAAMEARLRQGLAGLDPALAALEGRYRQVPVSFCRDGEPLAGPVAGAPGLWALTGFSGAFALVPAAAEQLAASVMLAAAGGSA